MTRHTLSITIKYLFVICPFTPLIGAAQPPSAPDWPLVHTVTMEGITSLYNFKFTDAEAKFNEVIRMAPQDPRGYFFKAMISYYRYEFMRIDADYERFMRLSDSVIETAENVIDSDGKNSNAFFYLGGIYGYRGIVHSEKEEILPAVWDGKKGYGYLQDALEIDPKNYDAQMGVGLFNYYLSKMPKTFRWIASMIGFEPDRELGMKMLERTAAKGTYARNEARWWLSQFYQWEDQPEKGVKYLKELSDDYPSNPFYVQQYGFALLFQLHRVDDALPVFQRATAMTNREAERYIIQGYYRLGHAYRFKNQFKEAIEWYRKYLALEKTDSSRIQGANHYLGLCHELLGDRATALTYYQQATRQSSERLKNPMSRYEIDAEKMSNWFSAGYDSLGENAGTALLARQDLTDDQRGQVLLNTGSRCQSRKDFTRAATHYSQITGLSIKKETWIPPNAHYQLGLCYLRNGQKSLAKEEFKKTLEFEKYEGEENLRERAEEELEKTKD